MDDMFLQQQQNMNVYGGMHIDTADAQYIDRLMKEAATRERARVEDIDPDGMEIRELQESIFDSREDVADLAFRKADEQIRTRTIKGYAAQRSANEVRKEKLERLQMLKGVKKEVYTTEKENGLRALMGSVERVDSNGSKYDVVKKSFGRFADALMETQTRSGAQITLEEAEKLKELYDEALNTATTYVNEHSFWQGKAMWPFGVGRQRKAAAEKIVNALSNGFIRTQVSRLVPWLDEAAPEEEEEEMTPEELAKSKLEQEKLMRGALREQQAAYWQRYSVDFDLTQREKTDKEAAEQLEKAKAEAAGLKAKIAELKSRKDKSGHLIGERIEELEEQHAALSRKYFVDDEVIRGKIHEAERRMKDLEQEISRTGAVCDLTREKLQEQRSAAAEEKNKSLLLEREDYRGLVARKKELEDKLAGATKDFLQKATPKTVLADKELRKRVVAYYWMKTVNQDDWDIDDMSILEQSLAYHEEEAKATFDNPEWLSKHGITLKKLAKEANVKEKLDDDTLFEAYVAEQKRDAGILSEDEAGELAKLKQEIPARERNIKVAAKLLVAEEFDAKEEAAIKERDAAIEEIRKKQLELTAEIEGYEKEHAALRADGREDELAVLKKEHDELAPSYRKELEELEKELKLTESRVESAQKSAVKAANALAEAKRSRDVLGHRLALIKAEMEANQTRISELEKKVREYRGNEYVNDVTDEFESLLSEDEVVDKSVVGTFQLEHTAEEQRAWEEACGITDEAVAERLRILKAMPVKETVTHDGTVLRQKFHDDLDEDRVRLLLILNQYGSYVFTNKAVTAAEKRKKKTDAAADLSRIFGSFCYYPNLNLEGKPITEADATACKWNDRWFNALAEDDIKERRQLCTEALIRMVKSKYPSPDEISEGWPNYYREHMSEIYPLVYAGLSYDNMRSLDPDYFKWCEKQYPAVKIVREVCFNLSMVFQQKLLLEGISQNADDYQSSPFDHMHHATVDTDTTEEEQEEDKQMIRDRIETYKQNYAKELQKLEEAKKHLVM